MQETQIPLYVMPNKGYCAFVGVVGLDGVFNYRKKVLQHFGFALKMDNDRLVIVNRYADAVDLSIATI